MAGFGGAVKLTGESEYRAALEKITQSLKEVSSEMKLVSSAYDKNDKSIQANEARMNALNKQLDTQQQKLELLKSRYADMLGQFTQQATEHNKLVETYKKEKDKLEEIGRTLGTTSNEYKDQKEKVDALEKEVEESTKAYDKSEKAMSQMRTEINKTEADCNKTAKEMDNLGKETEETAEEAEKAGEGFTVMKGALADLVSHGIQAAIQGMKRLATQIVSAGMSFDSAMAGVGAISGATNQEMELLEAKAKELGETTAFTATEVASGFKYMAMAGWETEDMLEGISGILSLAAASGEDLGTTSDIVTDALTAMGYAAGDAGKLANVMAAASSKSNTNVSLMGETFKYAAPLVGALGFSMEDTAVAIGLMANAGVKGTQAGTSLRSMLSRLSAPTGATKKAMEELGISLTDDEGNMRSLNDIIQNLRSSFKNLSATEKSAYASTIAGKNAMSGFLAIVNSADDDFNRLTAAVNNSTGAAKDMADTMLDNVGGQLTLLKSQWEGVMLSIWENLAPSISKAMDSVSKALRSIDWEAVGKAIGSLFEGLVNAFVWIIDHGDLVISVIKGIVAAFVAAKVANFVSQIVSAASALTSVASAAGGATTGLTGLFTSLGSGAGAVTLVVAGLAGLLTCLISLTESMKEHDKYHEEFISMLESDRDTLDKNTESWEALSQAQQEMLNQGMSEQSYYEDLVQELKDITDENGNVKRGYEERAGVIMTTLKEAFGVESELIDGAITDYGELMDTLDDVVAKRRAQIILDSQADKYSEAIKNQNEALLKQAEYKQTIKGLTGELHALEMSTEYKNYIKEVNELTMKGDEASLARITSLQAENAAMIERRDHLKEDIKAAQDYYNDNEKMLEQYTYNISTYEDNMVKAQQGRYEEMTTISWEYVSEQGKITNAKKNELQKELAAERENLSMLKKAYSNYHLESDLERMQASQRKINALKTELKDMGVVMEAGYKGLELIYRDSFDRELSYMSGLNVEFKETAEGNIQAYVDGVAAGEPRTKEEMAVLASNCLATLRTKGPDFIDVGQYFTDGIITGIRNKEGTLYSAVSGVGYNMVNVMKKSVQVQSPSKATEEIGKYFMEGLMIGMDGEEDSVLSQIANFSKDAIDALDLNIKGIDTNFDYSDARYLRSPNVRQNEPNVDMVEAFKTALSQVKIVLDDEVAGEFIDKTVTNLVYA